MTAFEYELVHLDGRRERGRVLATSSKDALIKLQGSKGKVVSLRPVVDAVQKQNAKHASSGVLFIANLNLRLAGQLQAGIALRKALVNVNNIGASRYRADIAAVIHALDNGQPFSAALASRKVFPRFMVSMVSVGEATGALAIILNDVSEYYFELYELQTHLKQISLYPLMLCTMILGMLVAFIIFVVPSFASLYSMLNIELNAVLRGLLFVKEYLAVLVLLVALLLAALGWYLRRRCAQDENYLVDIVLRIPMLGVFVRVLQEVRFCRVMSMQLQAGVDLLSAIKVARNCVSGSALQDMIGRVGLELIRGVGMYEAAQLHNAFLSADTLEFIAVGEEGNGYGAMLSLAHSQARLRLKNITANLRTYLQPVIFLLTAMILAAILTVLLQPMLGVLENIGNNW